MRVLTGMTLIYLFPAFLAALFWVTVRWWVRALNAREVMASFRPSRRRVARSEWLLGVRTHHHDHRR